PRQPTDLHSFPTRRSSDLMKSLAIVGCGKLADIVADALIDGLLPDYKLIGTYSRTMDKASRLADKINSANYGYSCTPCDTVAALDRKSTRLNSSHVKISYA